MTKPEFEKRLRLISNVLSFVKISEDVIDAWYFMLNNEDIKECLACFYSATKTGELDEIMTFGPRELLKLVRQQKNPDEQPALIFERGPYAQQSGQAAEAWRLWGGASKWGFLPDPKYCEDSEHALATLRFEKIRYAEIYESLSKEEQQDQRALTHAEAVKALGTPLETDRHNILRLKHA